MYYFRAVIFVLQSTVESFTRVKTAWVACWVDQSPGAAQVQTGPQRNWDAGGNSRLLNGDDWRIGNVFSHRQGANIS